mmetsp:Transcript_112789/g.318891  ORF Transcript_112789/g.318891 Transcript_112789/m.318891 type:complete len:202 (-) Transcript_112789:105-710(-)
MPSAWSQSSSEYSSVYQSDSPSDLSQHHFGAETWLFTITRSPTFASAATVASNTSSGERLCRSGFAANVRLGSGTCVSFPRTSARLKGNRTQLNPSSAISAATTGSGCLFNPFDTICSMCAPYQLTQKSRTWFPSAPTTYRPRALRGNADSGTNVLADWGSCGSSRRKASVPRNSEGEGPSTPVALAGPIANNIVQQIDAA